MKKFLIFFLSFIFLFQDIATSQAITFTKINNSVPIKDIKVESSVDPSLLKIITTQDEPDRIIATSTVITQDPEEDNTKISTESVAVPSDESKDTPESNEEIDQVLPSKTNTGSINIVKEDVSPVIEKQEEELLIEKEMPEIQKAEEVKIEKKETENKIIDLDFSNIDVGAELSVCNLDSACSGDIGNTHWVEETNIFPENMSRWLKFSTEQNKIKTGILQISNFSFADKGIENIIYSKAINTGESVFNFNLLSAPDQEIMEKFILSGEKNVLELANTQKLKVAEQVKIGFWGKTWKAIKNLFIKPFSKVKQVFKKDESKPILNTENNFAKFDIKFNNFYLRVVPAANGKVLGKASNEVLVKLIPDPEKTEIEIYKPAKLYEVKIKDFKPVRGPEPGVCNGAMILDTDWIGFNGVTPVNKKAGDRICPAGYKGIGEKSWYESFWDFAKSGVNWVSAAYNELKESVVDGLAGLACGGDDTCRAAISAGLDIGMVAMGVPPSLPNFDELMDQGFNYLASEIAYQAGCPDVACKELIKENLKNVLLDNKNTNPSCLGEAEAHNMGIEPLCLPSNVKAHVDPLGTYRNAQVILEIKRNFEDGSSLMGAPYKLYFSNYGYNAGPVGTSIHNIEPYNASVEITEPLTGQVFENKSIIIPPLQKGESVDVPIVLIPAEYWVPGHKEAMQGWSTITYGDNWVNYQYDDWWKLYYSGTMSMGAAIDGCSENYGQSDCIVSSDQITVQLPNSLNP